MPQTKVPRRLFILLAAAVCLAASAATPPPSAARAEAQDAAAQARALLAESERQNLEDRALALETAHRALALLESAGDTPGRARAHALIAAYHTARSDLAEAVESFEAALRLWRELGDQREQANVLVELGYIENRRGEWAGALSFFAQAQSLFREGEEPFLSAQIAVGLGDVFADGGMPESSLEHYQRALALYERAGAAESHKFATFLLGSAHLFAGNHDEALAHLGRALASYPPGGLYAAICHQYLGRLHAARREPEAALRHLRVALPIYAKVGNPLESAQVRALIGQAHEQQGRYAEARLHYEEALAAFDKLSDRINQAAVLFALGRMELERGDAARAEGHLRRSIEATEHIRRVSTSRDLTAGFSAAVHERYEKYVECLMRLHEARPPEGFDARAFEAAELARARSLAELLRATQTSPAEGLDPALAERERALRQALRVKEDHRVALLGRAYRPQELADLDAELARLEGEYRQVAEVVRARHPAFEQAVRPAAWDLRRVQEQVVADGETVLLEYGLGERRGFVWAVTRERVVSRELPARARVEEAARGLYQLLSAPPAPAAPGELERSARELAEMVLAPVAGELRGKRRVVVVADGALHYIPFQVLPAPGADGEPLVAGREVVNAPSATVLGELRQEAARRRPAARTLAAFGDPVFASNYAQRRPAGEGGGELAALQPADPARLRRDLRGIEVSGDAFDPATAAPLFYARRELEQLAEVAEGGDPLVASEFDATREGLLAADLSQYSILHFATHGLLDPRRPENSGLVLSTVDREGRAREGFVGLRNVYGLRAPVSLVVLSACRTALGRDVRGEGLLGLTRGFMYAGASGVVSSLWKVDDEATAELMKRFYAGMLREGLTPAEALRAAQNHVRQKPEWSAPYYWAAFTLQGEHRQVIAPRPAAARKAWWLALGASLLLTTVLSAAGYLRRRGRGYSTSKK